MPASASARFTSAARLGSTWTASQLSSAPSSAPTGVDELGDGLERWRGAAARSSPRRHADADDALVGRAATRAVPSRTSRPAAMIPTTSARTCTSASRWLETNTVLPRGGEAPQRLAHRHDAGRVEAVRGLVEQEQLRVAEQRAGDPEPLLHAQRVAGDLVPSPGRAARRARAAPRCGPRAPARPAAASARRFCAAGQVRVERRRLDQRADLEQALPIAAPERPAEQLDRARVRVEQAGEQAHRRRLAGAVRAEEAVDDAARARTGRGRRGRAASRSSCAGRASPGRGRRGRSSPSILPGWTLPAPRASGFWRRALPRDVRDSSAAWTR